MGSLSALIVRKDGLPSTAELTAAVAEAGSTIVFPQDFQLDRTPKGQVAITLDGEAARFDYSVDALADMDVEAAPAKLRKYGDTMLSFEARGALSGEAILLIQRVMAARWKAAGWIEDELITPAKMGRDDAPTADMDPALAAMMTGTPAQRAAAQRAYVEKHYPPRPPSRWAWLDHVNHLIIPAIIFLIFAAIYFWTRQT